MDTPSIIPKDFRDLFKEKNVVLIGDSILRGLYKDLACLLSGNDRLLYSNELKFNRHQEKNRSLFGERIQAFFIDRKDSTKNVEKRIFESTEFKYHLKYIFTSRIWNNRMEENLLCMKDYDIVILSSQIWDLTRYGVEGQRLYLENLETCFKQLNLMKKNVLWVTTPPVNAEHRSLDDLLSKMNPLSLEKAKKYDFFILDLHEKLKNHVNFQAEDGIHFNPQGQRLITQYLIGLLSQVPVQKAADVIYQPPPFQDEYSSRNILPSNDQRGRRDTRMASIQNSRYNRDSTFNRRKEENAVTVEQEETLFHSKKIKLTASHAEFIGVACGAAIRTMLN